MRRRRRLLTGSDETENFWPSFTDLTSTIALILFVLVLLAYIQNLVASRNLEGARRELSETLEKLASSQQRLRLTQAEIELGQARLKLSEQKIAQQEAIIAESTSELTELRERLRGIALLRLDVLRKVKSSIESQLSAVSGGSAPAVAIAENGNIVINESVLFEYNSHAIKREGKAVLENLAHAFAEVLSDPSVRENIDVILIQGHTDERGSVSYNRELSSKRANNVLDYMFSADPALENEFGSYFASSAYSEFRPVNTEKTESAYQQNRRIEISVVPKDANVRTVIDTYLQNLDPMFRPSP